MVGSSANSLTWIREYRPGVSVSGRRTNPGAGTGGAPYGRIGDCAGSTSTELRALLSSVRTSPPITRWPGVAAGCEPTTISSTGPVGEAATVALGFSGRAYAVWRSTSLTGLSSG